MNFVVLTGRLTRDVEMAYNHATGNAMARFSLAVDRPLSREKRQELEEKNQPTADFVNIVCWGKLAESCERYTAKGKRVLVQGRIQTGSYEGKDGAKRYTTDIVAMSVEFLDWKERPEQAKQEDFFGSDFVPIKDDKMPF